MAIQFDNTNTGVVTLKPAASGTLTLTLPSADGTANQVIATDGSGNLSFTDTLVLDTVGITANSGNQLIIYDDGGSAVKTIQGVNINP